MKPELSQKIETFVEMLHGSALPTEIKEVILKNAAQLSERQMDEVIESLKKEQDAFGVLRELAEKLEAVRSDMQREIQNETRPIVQEHIDTFIRSISENKQ